MSSNNDDFSDVKKDDTPDVVPEKLKAPFNSKYLILIIGIITIIQTIIYFSEEEPIALIYTLSMGVPLAIGILSFVNAKKYSGMLVYGRGYVALGIAFLGLFGGEFTYFIYEEVLELDPYPSIADVFFYTLYIMTIVYLLIHIRFFTTTISNIDKIWMVVIPIGITTIYWIVSFSIIEELNFDFYYGIAFVAAISTTLSLAIYGIKIFRTSLTGKPWILLLFGIASFTIGDTWYYTLELFGGYDLVHPVNMLWYAGYFVIIYALIHHRKVF